MDETTPVIVGVGRYTMRAESVEQALTPLELLLTGVKRAVADLGLSPEEAATAMRRTGAVGTCNIGPITVPTITGGDGSWTNVYPNPPKSVAKALGAEFIREDRFVSGLASGHQPQLLVNLMADGISRRDFSTAVVCGAEFLHTLKRALKEGYSLKQGDAKYLNWGDDPGGRPVRLEKKSDKSVTKQEFLHGLSVPVNTYPLFETALRAHLGRSIEEHSYTFSAMWSGLSRVAAGQPEHAWFPQERSPAEMCEPSARNRWVGTPYTKFHCSFLEVDQAAALVLMSVAEARRCRIPESKWVYLHGAAEATEKPVLLRPELHRSPAVAAMGEKCLGMAGISVDRIKHFDIYSCFPSAVQIVCREIGINHSDGSWLTTTGGIPFHGGPGANYSMHAIAAMVEKLRANAGDFGLVTANGGFLSKHAAGLYSTTPFKELHADAQRWQREAPSEYQSHLDAAADIELASSPSGFGFVETYTVAHGAQGPSRAIVVGQLQDGPDSGKRFVATSAEASTLRQMCTGDALGLRVRLETKNGCCSFTVVGAAASRL